jgi:protocatechuate 3,4-dioxygenase beta subunit
VRTPHIHFRVVGGADRLTTQMYFPGEKLNDRDAIYNAIPRTRKRRSRARVAPGEDTPSRHVDVRLGHRAWRPRWRDQALM